MDAFACGERPELAFGSPTIITGGNGRGKTSIADAIAFAVTVLPFFGERGIDRLHNEIQPDVAIYVSERAKLTFSALKMNKVEISLYDIVKITGERKDVFKFTYDGRRYDRLSLSEKIRGGMEVSELMKRLTGRNYPVFVDNMESVDDLANVRPTGQVIMAKCVSGTPLAVRPVKPIAAAEQRAA